MNTCVRSKVAKRIPDETPAEVRIFVRQYTDMWLELMKSRKQEVTRKNILHRG